MEQMREEALVAKLGAREAALRVREQLRKDKLREQQLQRERKERERRRHEPQPRRRERVAPNDAALQFSAEQRRINEQRRQKAQDERRERERLELERCRMLEQQHEQRRLREKEEQLELIRQKKEQHRQSFERTERHLEAARRASHFQQLHPELSKTSTEGGVATVHPRRYSVQVPSVPDRHVAVERIKHFRQLEDEKRRRQQQQHDEDKKQRHVQHREKMLRLRQQRSLSCSREFKQQHSPRSRCTDSRSIDARLREIKTKFEQLQIKAHN